MPVQPLSGADARVVDSIFKHIQKTTIDQGYMPDVDTFGDTELEAQRYALAIEAVQLDKGFHIEVFNQSSARRKAAKKTARFVVYLSRVYDGEIGAGVEAIMSNDVNEAGKYESGFLPTKTSSLVIAIHLITSVSQQFYVLNSILGRSIAQRRYLNYYDKATNTYLADKRFLAEQTSYNDLDDALEGVFEKVFYYTVPDIYLDNKQVTKEVTPINQITVITQDEPQFVRVSEANNN